MKYFEVIANGIRLDMFECTALSTIGFYSNLVAHYDLDNCSELIIREVTKETYVLFEQDVDADAQDAEGPVKYPSVPLY